MSIPRDWRLKKQRYGLVGEICPNCSSKLFPPRDVCPECGAPTKVASAVSDRREVFSYCIICRVPASLTN